MSCLLFSVHSLTIGPTSDRCENFKKMSGAIFQDFYPRKKTFEVELLERVDRKLKNDVFWLPNKKLNSKFSGSAAFNCGF